LDSDNITNDASPTFTGTCETGMTVALRRDGSPTGNSVTCAGAAYTITDSTISVDGIYAYNVFQTDPAGNVSANSSSLTVTIDTAAPPAPGTAPDMTPGTDSAVNNDDITSDTTPDFTGSCTTGETVTLRESIAVLGSVVCTGVTYTITSIALSDGVHPITTTFTDPAGNESTASPALSVTIDTSAPTVSTLSPADNATGVSPTADLVLTFGESVVPVTGNITIKRTSDNSLIETIDVTGAQVTGGGTATITVNPSVTLADLTEFYVLIDATAFDDLSGNGFAGISNTTAWSFTTSGAGSPPSTLSFVRQTPAAQDTNANTLIFRATFSEDVVNVSTGDFAVNGTTTATVTNVTSVSASTYDVTISGGNLASFNGSVGLNLDPAQNIQDTSSNALPGTEPATDETYTVDNAAPSAPTITAPTTEQTVNNPTTVTGACETGATVSIANANLTPNPTTGTCTASAYSIPVTWNGGTSGSQTLTVTQTDPAGNTSSSSTVNVNVSLAPDTTAPAAPVLQPIDNNDLTITGTGEPGATIALTNASCSNAPIIVAANGS
jgi:hypothetical protein